MELLVVIGIIAVLISILLPALNAARRSANQTKCAAQMKQLGNGYFLYAAEYRGWYPPVKMSFNTGAKYSLNDQTYEVGLVSIAVPIYNSAHSVVAAISVSGLDTRLKPRQEELLAALRSAAEDASKLPF